MQPGRCLLRGIPAAGSVIRAGRWPPSCKEGQWPTHDELPSPAPRTKSTLNWLSAGGSGFSAPLVMTGRKLVPVHDLSDLAAGVAQDLCQVRDALTADSVEVQGVLISFSPVATSHHHAQRGNTLMSNAYKAQDCGAAGDGDDGSGGVAGADVLGAYARHGSLLTFVRVGLPSRHGPGCRSDDMCPVI